MSDNIESQNTERKVEHFDATEAFMTECKPLMEQLFDALQRNGIPFYLACCYASNPRIGEESTEYRMGGSVNFNGREPVEMRLSQRLAFKGIDEVAPEIMALKLAASLAGTTASHREEITPPAGVTIN